MMRETPFSRTEPPESGHLAHNMDTTQHIVLKTPQNAIYCV